MLPGSVKQPQARRLHGRRGLPNLVEKKDSLPFARNHAVREPYHPAGLKIGHRQPGHVYRIALGEAKINEPNAGRVRRLSDCRTLANTRRPND